MQEFPILDEADQLFGAILNNKRATMRLRYNPSSERWSLDLSIDDEPVLYGYRLTVGIDILRSFNFDLGKLVLIPFSETTKPDRTALPDGLIRLYHVTDEEWAEFVLNKGV